MRYALVIIGAIMELLGIVWILQGIGILGGSAMSGQTMWAFIGVIVLSIGGFLLGIGIRMIRSHRPI